MGGGCWLLNNISEVLGRLEVTNIFGGVRRCWKLKVIGGRGLVVLTTSRGEGGRGVNQQFGGVGRGGEPSFPKC